MRKQKITRRIAKLLVLSLILSGMSVTPLHATEIEEPSMAAGQGGTEEPEEAEEAAESEGTEEPVESAESEGTEEPVESAESEGTEESGEAAEPEETEGQEGTAEPEDASESEEAEEPEEAEETVEPVESAVQEEPVAAENVSVPEMNDKMAGSDGIFYDDVLYLSVGNVMAMDERLQTRYRRLCDEIAAAKNDGVELENVVFAMDADGTLHCSYSVSTRGLDTINAGIDSDLEETSIPDPEAGEETELLPDPEAEKQEEAELLSVQEAEKQEEAEFTVFEENMDRISVPEAETFEVIQPVRLTDEVDLGYGRSATDSVQTYSLLPSEDYYREQLTEVQKKVYDAAKDTLIKGINEFTVTVQAPDEIGWDDMAHAVSALMLAYPAETDWMRYCPDRLYGVSSEYNPSGTVEKAVVYFGVSDFYSSSLEQRAQEKVEEVGHLAIQYAVENYPDVLTYGVVKYLDQWVCENGYFSEEKGGVKAFNRLCEAGENADTAEREAYYKCHTAYGILLEGYGVCEGYAKTMSRLLDAVGIPNLFVVGEENTNGHSWNYVQMPNGKWYLLDTTYNDASGSQSHTKSTMKYLLVKEDGRHVPDGNVLHEEKKTKFSFPARSDSNYDAGSEYDADSDYGSGNGRITLSKTESSMIPREKETLTYTIEGDWDYSKTAVVWSSSDTKVAKVDKKGVVTAVAPGMATIYLTASGMSAECRINVDQIRAIRSENTGKTSESVSLGMEGEKKDKKTIALTVDMGKFPHTAEWMIQQGKAGAPQAVCSRQSVAVTDLSVSGNSITIALEAVSQGNANVSVKFAGKTVTLKTAAGQLITEDMFDVIWPEAVREEGENRKTPYTGKTIRPAVKKKPDVKYRQVSFRTTYVHNKDAGLAKVVVTGSGKYAGTIEYPFVITPIDITGADFSKALKSKTYSGGANPPATVVKLGRKTLKANREYEILYNNETESELREKNGGAIPVGSYTIMINGKGNYTGTVAQTQRYEVTPNTIARVGVAGAGSAQYTGREMKPYTVKIGRNILPETDYKITWYRGQGKKRNTSPMKTAPTAKGKFTAVITVEGSNLTETDRKKEIVKNFTIR